MRGDGRASCDECDGRREGQSNRFRQEHGKGQGITVTPQGCEQMLHSVCVMRLDSEEQQRNQYKQSRTVPMKAVRLCSTRSESLRRTFLDRVSKTGGLHSKSLRPCPGRCVEMLGAFRLRLRLKPLSWVDGSFLRRGPQRPAFLRVLRGEVRSLECTQKLRQKIKGPATVNGGER